MTSHTVAIIAAATVLSSCAPVHAPRVDLDRTRLHSLTRITLLETTEPLPHQVMTLDYALRPTDPSLYEALKPELGQLVKGLTLQLQQQLEAQGYRVSLANAPSDISREALKELVAQSDAVLHVSLALFLGPNENSTAFVPWVNGFYTFQTASLEILSRQQITIGKKLRVSDAHQLDARSPIAFQSLDDVQMPKVAAYFRDALKQMGEAITADLSN